MIAGSHNYKRKTNRGDRYAKLRHNYGVSPLLFDMTLQRTIGNKAVQELFKQGFLNAKLFVNQPGDVYEQEADKVAEKIINSSDPGHIEISQKQNNSAAGSESVSSTLETQIKGIEGKGHSLPSHIRNYYTARFGIDLGNVQLHTNQNAGRLARAINARAFTLGQNIVFAEGEYSPETRKGKKLLAHELTHVIQQNTIARSHVQRETANDVANNLEKMEKEFGKDFKDIILNLIESMPDSGNLAKNFNKAWINGDIKTIRNPYQSYFDRWLREKGDPNLLGAQLKFPPPYIKTINAELKKQGLPEIDKNDVNPHHIVPSGEPKALEARTTLQLCKIQINDGCNGIYLLDSKGKKKFMSVANKLTFTPVFHSETFQNKYMDKINKELRGIRKASDARAKLGYISKKLADGTFI